jgi:hypothetical protein
MKEEKVDSGPLRDFIDGIRLMKKILSWPETWIPALTAVGWVGYMLVYTLAHSLSNPWRSIIIWGMILTLVVVTPGVMFLSGRKQQ